MKISKILLIIIAVTLFLPYSDNIYAQTPYKSGIGGVIYSGIASGPSVKTFFTDKVAFQTDLLFRLTATGNKTDKKLEPVLYMTLEADFNIVYQKKLKEASNWYWFIGGGTGIGYQLIAGNGKFGVNAIGGFEYVCEKTPLTIQIDLRPGYAMLFNPKDKQLKEMPYLYTRKNPWSHFDWLAGFTLRYAFKEKMK